MPGRKLSWPSFVEPIGIRTTDDQLIPSADVDITMSLAAQPARKRQSCQATYTLPAPSISAEGSGPLRRLPASPWLAIVATGYGPVYVAPPSTETNDSTLPSFPLS